MNTRTLLVLTLTAAVSTSGGTRVYADDYVDFLEKYSKNHQAATQHLWWNVKVSGTRTRYDDSYMPPLSLTEDRFNVIADGGTLIFQLSSTGRGKHAGKDFKSGGMINNDVHFNIGYKDDGTSFIDDTPTLPWDQKHHAYYYGTYTGLSVPLHWPLFRLYIGRGPNRYFRPDPVKDAGGYVAAPGSTFSVRKESRNGADCIAVRMESPSRDRPQDYIYYLDPRTYLVIAREQIGMPMMSSRQVEPVRKVMEVSYGPPSPDTGLPFPTGVKTTYHLPDGKILPGQVVVFTEYRRYTPTPDEVDVEKVLKVKMPAIPPRPPLPPEGQYLDPEKPGELLPASRRSGRSAWWWYAGAGVMLAVAIVAGLRVRRNRRALP